MKFLNTLPLVLLAVTLSTNFSFGQDVQTSNYELTGWGPNMRFLWIPGLPGPGNIKYNSTETSLNFDVFSDGTCHIYGHVHNQTYPIYGWDLDMWFKEKADWNEWSADSRGWKGETEIVGDLYETWDYYIMDDSKTNSLTGTGPYEGSFLELFHSPSNYYYGLQVGEAANAQDGEDGISCWMHYNGQVSGIEVCGDCDINGDISCSEFECPEDVQLSCTDELEELQFPILNENCNMDTLG